ncbi:MAG: FkbM family methyltransferase [Candidatus Kapabacteria bacterium]|nr:FkbM family methyltransferase [Ignavibacteriota bacterium]MCW5885094.1 FkbM family methyltransferase [Candidatus Kapabacteria bacterium]
MEYFSQSNQDKFVDKIIFGGNKTNGYFLEIGAYDGITFSNTYTFEKYRNWKGICVEPIPTIFNKLRQNRKCDCIQGCIAEKEGVVQITHVDGPSEMLTGITKNYDAAHSERIENEIKERGGKKVIYDVKAYNLTDILIKKIINHIDYCSIDVEGSEWEVLKSIDFDKISFSCFSIENNYDDVLIVKFMCSKGYEFLGKLEADDIYVSKKNQNIFRLKMMCKLYNFKNKSRNILSKFLKK